MHLIVDYLWITVDESTFFRVLFELNLLFMWEKIQELSEGRLLYFKQNT